jgi:hypothetical protein
VTPPSASKNVPFLEGDLECAKASLSAKLSRTKFEYEGGVRRTGGAKISTIIKQVNKETRGEENVKTDF